MRQAYSEIALSPSAKSQAEIGGRSMIRDLEALEATGQAIGRSTVIDAGYDEMMSRCGSSQYDSGAGQDRWWAMREIGEQMVFAAHPEWDVEDEEED
jgi:hypothetical protein